MKHSIDQEVVEQRAFPAVVSPQDIESIKNAHERVLGHIAKSENMDVQKISHLVSAWNLAHSPVSQGLKALAPKILASLLERKQGLASDFAIASQATLFVLSEGQEAATHAHQDMAYRYDRSVVERYAYTTWIPLDDCDENSGALKFSDGFLSSPVGPREDFLEENRIDPSETAQWKNGECVVCVKAGDAVVFDAAEWHASAPFNQQGSRLALAIRWSSKSGWERNVQIERPALRPGTFGMDTSGKFLCKAINTAICSSAASEETSMVLGKLIREHINVFNRLTPLTRQTLLDLKLALTLEEKYHARTAADVWFRIRDIAIPELLAFGSGGGS